MSCATSLKLEQVVHTFISYVRKRNAPRSAKPTVNLETQRLWERRGDIGTTRDLNASPVSLQSRNQITDEKLSVQISQ